MINHEIDPRIQYTHLVLGAGSAGCAAAARLATNPDFNVLLVEAGPDYPTKDVLPNDLADATVPSQLSHDWNIKASGTGARTMPMIRGKVVGGSSAVNACIALRAEPDDFDSWMGSGDVRWTWESVLPYYKKLESDLDFPESEYHGASGPIPIRRWKPSELHPLSVAMQKVCFAAGFSAVADHNLPYSTGYGPSPMNAIDGHRVSTAEAYLDPVRNQDNLTIVSDCLVDRILFEKEKAIGVLALDLARRQSIYHADTIVMSTGAFGTPAILLRSGIGPRLQLEKFDIPAVVDLPGVGANLADHSQIPVGAIPKLDYAEFINSPCIQTLLRYSSEDSERVNDMQLCLLNRVEVGVYAPYLIEAAAGREIFFTASVLMLPDSRGSVSLKSANPYVNPVVNLNFCASEMDVKRHREGLRRSCELLVGPVFKNMTNEILESDSLFGNDDTLDKFITERIQTAHHPCGTARMGKDTDQMAVVDSTCAVLGVENLYVADASIMPAPVRANTNLTCIMIGERVAAELIARA